MDATLTGNITRDPELRFTPSGQATASFGLAVNRSWVDRQSQERKESTSFFDIVAWGTLAENIATSLHKGDRVIVGGRLEQRSWETPDGDKRHKVEIVADEIGPSLRWATSTVTRNAAQPQAQAHTATEAYTDEPPAQAASQAKQATAKASAPVALADYDEEPF